MIAAGNRASHALASTQLRGHYSAALSALRGELLQLASLLELELDFSEEDVTFADRTALRELLDRATNDIAELADSFLLGNAIREGIPASSIRPVSVKATMCWNEWVSNVPTKSCPKLVSSCT